VLNLTMPAVALLRFHRSLGLVIWLVTAGCFAWRRLFASLPPFPANMPHASDKGGARPWDCRNFSARVGLMV
jgi:hypothetical protein